MKVVELQRCARVGAGEVRSRPRRRAGPSRHGHDAGPECRPGPSRSGDGGRGRVGAHGHPNPTQRPAGAAGVRRGRPASHGPRVPLHDLFPVPLQCPRPGPEGRRPGHLDARGNRGRISPDHVRGHGSTCQPDQPPGRPRGAGAHGPGDHPARDRHALQPGPSRHHHGRGLREARGDRLLPARPLPERPARGQRRPARLWWMGQLRRLAVCPLP